MTHLLLLLAAAGHAILWAAIVNRLHGTALRQSLRHFTTGFCLASALLLPLLVGLVAYRDAWLADTPAGTLASHVAWGYVVLCAAVCVAATAHWMWLRFHAERRGALLSNHTAKRRRPAASEALTAPGIPSLLSRLPGNQILEIHVREKEIAIPRLPPALDGLRIAHISDLHMSGRIAKAYFEQVVDEVNQTRPELIALTGDIVEREKCIAWIPDTLGRLRAAHGVYYVLGNHDRCVSCERLNTALTDAGLIHLGNQWQQIEIQNTAVLLVGNELPWFKPGPDLTAARGLAAQPLRILLCHTPDQFRWAQQHNFDLMLAGHIHGGQVCLPFIGPILAPSLHGVRYAAGIFRARNTVMHVSRGTSGLTPLRFNCPPEIAVLILRRD